MVDVDMNVRVRTTMAGGDLDKIKSDVEGKMKGLSLGDFAVPGPLKGLIGSFQHAGKVLQKGFSGGSGIMNKLFGKLGGEGGGGGGGGKGMSGFGKSMVVLAAMTFLLQGIFSLIKKGVEILMEASPMFKATVKLLTQGFLMILRPIGDALSMLLRPVALFFRAIGRAVIMKMLARRKELLASGMSQAEVGLELLNEMPSMYMEVFGEALSKVDWSFVAKVIGDLLWLGFTTFNPVGMLIKFLMEHADEIAKVPLQIATWILDTIATGVTTIARIAADIVIWLFKALGDGVNTLGKLGADIINWIFKGFGAVADTLGKFGEKVVNWIIEHLGMGGAAADTVKKIAQGATTTEEFVAKTVIPSLSPWTMLGNLLTGKGLYGAQSGNAIVTQTGALNVHKGEIVQSPGQIQSMVRQAVEAAIPSARDDSIMITISGRDLADAIDKRIDYNYKGQIRRRIQ